MTTSGYMIARQRKAITSDDGNMSGLITDLKGFNFSFNNNDDNNYTDDEYVKKDEKLDKFSDIDLDVDLGQIEIDKGDDYTISVEYNKKYADFSYDVKHNKLVVTSRHRMNTGFNTDEDKEKIKVKIYVPEDSDISNLDFKVKCGELSLNNMKCKELKVDNKLGNINGKNIETDNFEGNLASGSLYLDTFKAENSVIETKLGDIKGRSFVTNGLNAEIKTGGVDIEGKLSGKNTIKSGLGEVKIKTDIPKEECGYNVDMSLGDCSINGKGIEGGHESYNKTSENMYDINCKSGNIELDFSK